jgi:hypothetical protein
MRRPDNRREGRNVMKAPFSRAVRGDLRRPLAIGALLLLLLPLAAGLLHTHRHEPGTGRVLLHGAVESDQTKPCDSTHLHRGASPPTGLCPICLLHRLGVGEPATAIAMQAAAAFAGTAPPLEEAGDYRPCPLVPPSRAPPSA